MRVEVLSLSATTVGLVPAQSVVIAVDELSGSSPVTSTSRLVKAPQGLLSAPHPILAVDATVWATV